MNTPARSGTIRSIGTLLTGSVVAQVIGLATMPVLSRIFTPQSFGLLAVFLSITSLVAIVASLRYEYAIVLPEADEDAVHLKRAATWIAASVSALALIVTAVVVLALLRENQTPWWLLLMGVSVFLAGESTILYFWFTRTRRYRVQSISRIVQAAVTAGTQILLGLTVLRGPEGLIIGYVVGQVVAVIVLLVFDDSRVRDVPRERKRTMQLLRRYRKMPLLNAPNALIDSFRLNGINLIIGIGAGSVAALGQFSMAWKLAQSPMALIAGAISQVYYQRMASAGPGELRRIVFSVTRNALIVGIVPFALLALCAPAVVPWLLGPQWVEAGLIVQALTPWLFLNVATAPLSNLFIVAERQGTMLVFALVYMVVPLVILWLLADDLVRAVWWTSGSMSVLLLILIGLSFVVATKVDAARPVSLD
ncbi:oligosaccharide flippase family protein [Microbacterium sp. A8/3-1]|uniref:Oligosaccharide flippase family protein n=1 Tax=Microbacterium sp. A8/3-1 TaxID=3160749 RepID=A0AAU7W107_9MICO